MVAPKVEGKVKPGGTYTAALLTTPKQHDMHTALASTIWHTIGDRAIEPHPVTNQLLPHLFTSWEVADPSGTTLIFKMNLKVYTHDMPPS